MNTWSWRVPLYRLRNTFARRWTGYLSVALLIGLIGGVAMASVAAGRRTQSSFPVFLASTNPSTLSMSVYRTTANGGPGPSLTPQIQRLPSVARVETIFAPPLVEIEPNGTPNLNSINDVVSLASLNGLNDQ